MLNPYSGCNVQYGPPHPSRETARVFWTGPNVEIMLGNPDIVHANNFWCPVQLASSRLIYTFYDMGFAVDPYWTTESNRVGCFDGVFRAAIAADWVVAIPRASAAHYLSVFPHFPQEIASGSFTHVLGLRIQARMVRGRRRSRALPQGAFG